MTGWHWAVIDEEHNTEALGQNAGLVSRWTLQQIILSTYLHYENIIISCFCSLVFRRVGKYTPEPSWPHIQYLGHNNLSSSISIKVESFISLLLFSPHPHLTRKKLSSWCWSADVQWMVKLKHYNSHQNIIPSAPDQPATNFSPHWKLKLIKCRYQNLNRIIIMSQMLQSMMVQPNIFSWLLSGNIFEVWSGHKNHCLCDIYWNLQTRFEIYNWRHLVLFGNNFIVNCETIVLNLI